VSLFLDICQGIGLALAIGIRPLLPTLLIGALASGDLGLDFDGTDYSFLESPGFLLAVVVVLLAWAGIQRAGGERVLRPLTLGLVALSLPLGALEFAGSLADRHHTAWPGLIAGAACAALAAAATAPLLTRVSARLDAAARAFVPLYGEGAGLLLAGLAVLAPPVSLLALAGLAWLLLASRRRAGEKYAGLRILR
jgi:hypothetical protein